MTANLKTCVGLLLLVLATFTALGQPTTIVPATQAEADAGVLTRPYISPATLQGRISGMAGQTNGITAGQATNIAAYQALIATNAYDARATNIAAYQVKIATNGIPFGALTNNETRSVNLLGASNFFSGQLEVDGNFATYGAVNYMNAGLGIGVQPTTHPLHMRSSGAGIKMESTGPNIFNDFITTDGLGQIGIYQDALYLQAASGLSKGIVLLDASGANTVLQVVNGMVNSFAPSNHFAGNLLVKSNLYTTNIVAAPGGELHISGNITTTDSVALGDTLSVSGESTLAGIVANASITWGGSTRTNFPLPVAGTAMTIISNANGTFTFSSSGGSFTTVDKTLYSVTNGQVVTISTFPAPVNAVTNVAGMKLWLKPETLAGQGAQVASWTDSSGNGNHAAQGTIGNRPIVRTNVLNGYSGVEYITAGRSLTTPSMFNAGYDKAFSVYAVVKHTATALTVWGSTPANGFFGGGNSDTVSYFTANTTPPSVTFKEPSPGAYFTSMRYDGTNKLQAADGTNTVYLKPAATTGALGLTGGFTIGDLPGGGYTWDGQILEVMVFERALTDLENEIVAGYLRTKYALNRSFRPQIFFDGNSMTYGVGSSDNAHRYPDQTIALLGGSATYDWQSLGVTGQQTSDRALADVTDLDPFYGPDRTKNVAVLWEITNDLYYNSNGPAAYSRYVAWCQDRRRIGFQVVAMTVLPRSAGAVYAGFETDRQTVNASIRANWRSFADALVDLGADPTLGPANAETNLLYYADAVHLTDAGYAVVAVQVRNAILNLWTNAVITPDRLGTGGGGNTKFLREDSTWQPISGGGGTTDALTNNETRVVNLLGTSNWFAGNIALGEGKTIFLNRATDSSASINSGTVEAHGTNISDNVTMRIQNKHVPSLSVNSLAGPFSVLTTTNLSFDNGGSRFYLYPLNTGSGGQFLKWNGTSTIWATPPGTGTGGFPLSADADVGGYALYNIGGLTNIGEYYANGGHGLDLYAGSGSIYRTRVEGALISQKSPYTLLQLATGNGQPDLSSIQAWGGPGMFDITIRGTNSGGTQVGWTRLTSTNVDITGLLTVGTIRATNTVTALLSVGSLAVAEFEGGNGSRITNLTSFVAWTNRVAQPCPPGISKLLTNCGPVIVHGTNLSPHASSCIVTCNVAGVLSWNVNMQAATVQASKNIYVTSSAGGSKVVARNPTGTSDTVMLMGSGSALVAAGQVVSFNESLTAGGSGASLDTVDNDHSTNSYSMTMTLTR